MHTLIIGSAAALALVLRSGSDPTGLCRGTQLCECRWQEHRRGPGFKRAIPNASGCWKRGLLTAANALTVFVAAAAMFASVAIAQDASVQTYRLQSDIAQEIQPNRPHLFGQPRIIWRIPESRPRTWEEQRIDRFSQDWLFPATETGE